MPQVKHPSKVCVVLGYFEVSYVLEMIWPREMRGNPWIFGKISSLSVLLKFSRGNQHF